MRFDGEDSDTVYSPARGVDEPARLPLIQRVLAFRMRAQGFTGGSARAWLAAVALDRRVTTASGALARRMHSWGFTVESARRFGITAANRAFSLPLRTYLYAQPLNGKYAKWVKDRVSALMVFHPFEHAFERVHFQTYSRAGEARLIPISDEAITAGQDCAALGNVVREYGPLLVRSVSWDDDAFARLDHDGTCFLVDGRAYDTADFTDLLARWTRRASCVFVQPHDIPAGSLALDVTVLNATGDAPRIVEALVHVPATVPSGESRSAHSAPLFARVDPETGAFRGANRVIDGELKHFDTAPGTGEAIVGAVPGWDTIVDTLQRMGRFAPQLRFLQYRLNAVDGDFEIRSIAAQPKLSEEFAADADVVTFVREQAESKRAQASRLSARIGKGAHNAKLKIRREFAKALYPQGLLPYQSVRWLGDMRRDLFQRNGVDLKTKLWAYRNGFLSYRIPQYGITPDNRLDFISDFEYRWLRHINTRYKYWLEDKISIKYVASGFNEFLPGYYYATSPSGGRSHLIPMMDCPEGYGARFEDVLRLAREKGVLALKPDEGSHGDGFYRLGWTEDEGYSLNGEPASEDDVLAILRNPENRYLVTEFILMHPVLAEIYPTSVNTLRMTVFKRDGVTPQLGNAYLRIGSVASGFVDNTAAGGLLAEVDIASGRFGKAKSLVNGRVVETPNHPDTGVFIDGVIPNWEFVKEQVLKMAASFSQLEYLGFDVAITEDGFKIPEINRFPDFPRIDVLEPETVEYLLLKLDEKKRQFGYHRKRPRKLISLPRRGDV